MFWNAWGGDDRTEGVIAWENDLVSERFGLGMQRVRLRDTAEAVARVVTENAAGRTEGGSVDLVWINGPNVLARRSSPCRRRGSCSGGAQRRTRAFPKRCLPERRVG